MSKSPTAATADDAKNAMDKPGNGFLKAISKQKRVNGRNGRVFPWYEEVKTTGGEYVCPSFEKLFAFLWGCQGDEDQQWATI